MRYLVLLLACGHSAPPPPPARTTPPTIEAQAAGADDVVVAHVNGAPVYASCVENQASNLHLDAHAALDQCIAFELLAQAADAKGLRSDPDVIDTWRRESVRKLVETDLGTLHSFDDLTPDFAKPIEARLMGFTTRPEQRLAHWARAVEPCDAAPGSVEDAAAHDVADKAYQTLATDDGVLPDQLVQAMTDAAAGTNVQVHRSDAPFRVPPFANAPGVNTTDEFRENTYQIPKLGMVSPPFHGDYKGATGEECGWDIVLWWDTLPAADLVAPLFEKARQAYFDAWSDRIAEQDGIVPQVDRSAVDRALGTASGSDR